VVRFIYVSLLVSMSQFPTLNCVSMCWIFQSFWSFPTSTNDEQTCLNSLLIVLRSPNMSLDTLTINKKVSSSVLSTKCAFAAFANVRGINDRIIIIVVVVVVKSTHVRDILENLDYRLFRQISSNPQHSLNTFILTPVRSSTFGTRDRGHPYEMPRCKYNLHKQSLVNRCLFKCIWV